MVCYRKLELRGSRRSSLLRLSGSGRKNRWLCPEASLCPGIIESEAVGLKRMDLALEGQSTRTFKS